MLGPKHIGEESGSDVSESASRTHPSLRIVLAVHRFFPDYYLGTERYTLELAQALQELGHRPTVLTVGAPGSELGPGLYASYTYEGVPVRALRPSIFGARTFQDTLHRPNLDEHYRQLLRELAPDVLHVCHLIHFTPRLLAVAGRTGIPLFVTLTDFWGVCWAGQLTTQRRQKACAGPDALAFNCVADFYDAKDHPTDSTLMNRVLRPVRGTPAHALAVNGLRLLPGRARRRLAPEIDHLRRRQALLREAYAAADRWIAPSRHLLETYQRHGFPAEKGRRIPYGIAPPPPDTACRLEARYAPDRPADLPLRFGYMGQIAPHKGVRQLVEAFRAQAPPDATLAIHGELGQVPDYGRRVREACRDEPRITLHGPYPSVAAYEVLAEIDVLVVPSLWHENAPFVLLTALAAGTPVVIPRAHGMTEFVRHGDNGLVYEMNDTAGLARALREIADQREAFFERAAKSGAHGFTTIDAARATLDLYRDVLAEGREVRLPPPEDRLELEIEAWPEASPGPEATDPAAPAWDPRLLDTLFGVEAHGFEVKLPRWNVHDAPPLPVKPGWRPARPFRRVPRGVRVSYHHKPYASLWTHASKRLVLSRHPGFAGASAVHIVARGNRGGGSRLRYRFEGDGADRVRELEVAWSKESWRALRIPLVSTTGRRLRSLEWIPVVSDGRVPVKLDLLSIRFDDDAAARPR